MSIAIEAAELMERFYRGMLEDGLRPAAAAADLVIPPMRILFIDDEVSARGLIGRCLEDDVEHLVGLPDESLADCISA